MKLRFKYIKDFTYDEDVWSYVEIEGEGIWKVDVDELAKEYWSRPIYKDLNIPEYIEKYVTDCLKLDWCSIKFNKEDLAFLIVKIESYETC